MCVLSCSVMSDSLRSHGHTRLLCPWNSIGKNTGVGSHFLFQIHWIHCNNYGIPSSFQNHMEDARVWAHRNHFFDMHLSYLGPVSCIFTSCLLRSEHREWLQSDSYSMVGMFFFPAFPQGSPAHIGGPQLQMTVTSLIWQEIFHFSTL